MRLRLFIQRNRMPPVKIWWDTSSFEPGDDHNVSTFLSRVCQIVPLESGRWGLEDYAVEVDGFEVLHFQEVESVIREADEVVIRPLTTTEIRQRRMSGRRQISTSGRKLVDGTPFGRPLIMTGSAVDRPLLSIPPRKRAKVGASNVDDSTLVQVGSEDEDDSEDGSYKGSESGEEISDEGGQEENETEGEEEEEEEGDDVDGMDFEELSRDYQNPLMDYFDSDEEVSLRTESSQPKAICALDTQSLLGEYGSFYSDSSENDEDYADGSGRSQRNDTSDEGDSSAEVSSKDEEDGQDKTLEQPGDLMLPEDFYSDAISDESNPDSPKLPGLYSPGHEEEGGEDEGEEERLLEEKGWNCAESSKIDGVEEDEESSRSEDSSDSENSEKSDVSRGADKSEDRTSTREISQNRTTSTSQEPLPPRVSSVPPEQPRKLAVALGTLPYQGNPGTKARNDRKKRRRKNERLLGELIEKGVLPKGSNLDDLGKYNEGKGNTEHQKGQVNPREPGGEKEKSPEPLGNLATEQGVRDSPDGAGENVQEVHRENGLPVEGVNKGYRKKMRKAFARAKKKGNVPAGWDFSRWLVGRKKEASKTQPGKIDAEEGADGDVSMASVDKPFEQSSKVPQHPNSTSISQDRPSPPSSAPIISVQEKTRQGGPRKIIYDEDGNPNPVYARFNEQQHDTDDHPEAWRGKIVLSAVECEQEGVEMLEPTFPFQQPAILQRFRGEAAAGNKRKRNSGTKNKRRRKQDKENYGCDYGHQGYNDDDWDGHDYYDDSTVIPTPAKDEDTITADADLIDDLPPLPEEIASLHPLTQPVLPGTVVAFKQLMLGENYTPIMADYRTAIVESVHTQDGDGPLLELRLAMRDRPKRRIDPETGEKILRKFEMPGDENQDEGFLELMFGQLLEAKLVKLPEGANADQSDRGGGNGSGNGNDSDGAGSGRGEGSQEDNSGHPGKNGNVNHEGSQEFPEAESSFLDTRVHATLSDGPVPFAGGPGAGGSQDQEQDLELDLEPETQVAQENLRSPNPSTPPTPGSILSSIPTSRASTPIPPIADNGDDDLSYEPEMNSDSDGLETLETLFASSQRIKPEPSSQAPVLLPLPAPSPSGASIEEDEQSQRQIHEEAGGEKRMTLKATRRTRSSNGAKILDSQIQIIDLTETSDPIDLAVEEDRLRGKRGKPKGKGKQWRAVKG